MLKNFGPHFGHNPVSNSRLNPPPPSWNCGNFFHIPEKFEQLKKDGPITYNRTTKFRGGTPDRHKGSTCNVRLNIHSLTHRLQGRYKVVVTHTGKCYTEVDADQDVDGYHALFTFYKQYTRKRFIRIWTLQGRKKIRIWEGHFPKSKISLYEKQKIG